MHGLAGWLDSAPPPLVPAGLSAWRDPQRAILARGDLRALGQTTADDALPPPTPGEWIGGCYVMEGSALGGRLLLRQAESLQARHPEVAGALNFLRYHTRDPARWPRLLVILRALPRSSFDEAIRGAQAAFSLTHRLLAVLVPASPEIQ
ncbi:biliverdin-producing heme oxygenase [Agrilutibacter solisilvae]|uniref:Biliverdin-producing heme oxygenase n=1 Tax=Agrilutibacter solisilvae TaxID=2763317 RepID=A0A975AS35_9GAMM|nr:biliverdin-producing heme oxygenase [Lysobacter solisilvae]QSX77843.1 biliverdin-producing heme oxygenase [Lysobacter solisilvae]